MGSRKGQKEMSKYRWKVMPLFLAAALALSACGSSMKETGAKGQESDRTVEEAENKDGAGEAQPANEDGLTKETAEEEAQAPVGDIEAEDQEESKTPAAEKEKKSEIVIPDISMEQRDIPDLEAMEFVKNMKAGWNLGNTLDAFTGNGNAGLSSEQSWGMVPTTNEIVAAIKEGGFETIRIPVTWHNHLEKEAGSDSFSIDSKWLERVREVVDYGINNDLYVIINIHHDTGKSAYYPDSAHYEQSEQYIRTVWETVSEQFKDYDEHLIFESMNEPRLMGTPYEWNFQENVEECKDSIDCINKLNQVFVDTVRASGGKNADRYLMVPGYSASLAGEDTDLFLLPTDSAENKLIVSAHAYTPYNFALQPKTEGGSTDSFPAQAGAGRLEIDSLMNKLYQRFVSQGIPVVIGEYGAMNKNDNLQDRVNYYAYYVAAARARGITCCIWDNGLFGGDGELFGLYDRQAGEWGYPEIVDAVMKYAWND